MRLTAASIIIALAASSMVPRHAQAIACSNCAQEVTQILNHGELVFQAAQSAQLVAMEVRNLQALAQNFGGDIFQSMNAVRGMLGTVQRVTYEVGQAEEAFLARYKQAFGIAGVPEGMFGESAAQVYLDSRDDMSAAMQESVRIRSMAAEAMKLQEAQELAAGSASQASPGMLQAQQAGNALIQSLGSRLGNLQATLMSYHESQARAQRDGVLEQMVAEAAHVRNMSCFGDSKSNIVVDPYGLAASIKGN